MGKQGPQGVRLSVVQKQSWKDSWGRGGVGGARGTGEWELEWEEGRQKTVAVPEIAKFSDSCGTQLSQVWHYLMPSVQPVAAWGTLQRSRPPKL